MTKAQLIRQDAWATSLQAAFHLYRRTTLSQSMPQMARSVPEPPVPDTAPCQVALPSGATITHLDGQTRIAEHPGFGAAWLADDLDELIGALIHLREMRAGAR